jgi:hypothetical protein
MFSGYLSILCLCGAIICTLLAVVLTIVFANQRQRQRAEAAKPVSRADESVLRIANLLSTESGGVITAPHGRHAQEIPAQDLRRSVEVANGLQILSQASPEIALHDCNIALLARLREVTGANDFRYLCGQLATALTEHDPRYQGLALGLENGELSWNGFLAELRSMPMSQRF